MLSSYRREEPALAMGNTPTVGLGCLACRELDLSVARGRRSLARPHSFVTQTVASHPCSVYGTNTKPSFVL
jgi:hypothetical protein